MSIEARRHSTVGVVAAVSILSVSMSAFAQERDSGARWKYVIAPYLWGTSIDGTVSSKGREAKVSADVSDVVEFVDTAGAVRFEAIKQWGLFGDIWFASLSNKESTPFGDIKVSVDQSIAEAGGLYAFGPEVTGYFGARYQSVDSDITIPVIGKQSASENWIDAIVGLRYRAVLGAKWNGVLRADVGTGDSDLTWLAQLGVGYRFSDSWAGNVGYRHLDTNVKKNDFKWDLAQEGFGLGIAYEY